MKRNIFYIAIIISFFLALNFYFKVPEPQARQICPEDYSDNEAGYKERETATNKWITDFRNQNPNASTSDFARARYQFYMDNNCSATLEKYFEMEQTETEEEKIIRETIQEEMREQQMKNLIEALKDDQNKQTQ